VNKFDLSIPVQLSNQVQTLNKVTPSLMPPEHSLMVPHANKPTTPPFEKEGVKISIQNIVGPEAAINRKQVST
jgi:hypothetical protein